MKRIFAILSIGLLFSLNAMADRAARKQVAIDACESKELSATCSFEGRRGSVEGTCVEDRRDASVLICKDPNRPKRGERGQRGQREQ
ncbi:MAG: hypothetical protein KC478_01275 [Bacteriovoracaceae bacterium]|nr:hypothetical protein [Bacteriovoracaceae bacterium]